MKFVLRIFGLLYVDSGIIQSYNEIDIYAHITLDEKKAREIHETIPEGAACLPAFLGNEMCIRDSFYTTLGVPCGHPLPLPVVEVAERSEDGEGKL